jgi:drug/metabolite transporter (DMT)-like permease
MMNAAILMTSIALVVYSNLTVKSRSLALASSSSENSTAAYIVSMLLDPWVWTALAATVCATILWLVVIRRLELGVAQPAYALVFVAVPLAAAVFLGEPIPPLRIVGLVLIVAGVALVATTA